MFSKAHEKFYQVCLFTEVESNSRRLLIKRYSMFDMEKEHDMQDSSEFVHSSFEHDNGGTDSEDALSLRQANQTESVNLDPVERPESADSDSREQSDQEIEDDELFD